MTSKIQIDKFIEEILRNLKDAELGHNYFNIRVRRADVAKEVENAGGMGNLMLKSEYDANNDRKVDNAEHADLADNLTDKIIDGGNSGTIY